MPFVIQYGGPPGPGMGAVGLGLAQAKAQNRMNQAPSFGAQVAAGLGQGITQGTNLYLQNQQWNQQQDRLDKREDARQKAILERQMAMENQRLMQEKQLAMDQQALQAGQQASPVLSEYANSGKAPGEWMAEYDAIQNDWMALNEDPGVEGIDPDQRWRAAVSISQRKAQLSQKIPRPKSPTEEFAASVISGKTINDDLEKQIGARPFNDSAMYQKEIRSGSPRFTLVDGTGEPTAKIVPFSALPPQEQQTYSALNRGPGTLLVPDNDFGYRVHPDSAKDTTSKSGGGADADAKAYSAALDQAIKYQREINGPDKALDMDAIRQTTDSILNAGRNVGERTNETVAIENVQKKYPYLAKDIASVHQEVIAQSTRNRIPPEVECRNRLDNLLVHPELDKDPFLKKLAVVLALTLEAIEEGEPNGTTTNR